MSSRSNPFRQSLQAFPYHVAQIAITLGGSGVANTSGFHQARCPNHDDHRFSLSLKDTPNGLLAKCFVCQNAAAVEAAIREAMKGQAVMAHALTPSPPPLSQNGLSRVIARIAAASVPASGTLVERYASSRGISVKLPPTLLYHPELYHKSGTTGPAMVALVHAADSKTVPAIHRTWLAAGGSGKAGLDPVRMSLGPVSGHAVHLGRASPRLIVGEGIETTLSALQLWGPSSFDAWAALSTAGMAALIVPDTITEVIIAADNDDAGCKAAGDLQRRLRRDRPTLKVSVYLPRNGLKDFNDVLRSQVAA